MPAPCNFDHNGECLVCDAWPSDCAWKDLMNGDFKYRSERELLELFYPYMNDEEKIKLSLTMGKIQAPFTDGQVEALKQWQTGMLPLPEGTTHPALLAAGCIPTHPFTCCSHDGCKCSEREDQGILIPTKIGWTCPCGKYKQYWCHDYMVE